MEERDVKQFLVFNVLSISRIISNRNRCIIFQFTTD